MGGAKTITGKDCIEAIRKTVGLPGQEMASISADAWLSDCLTCSSARLPLSSDVPGVETAAKFLDSLPFFGPWFGQTGTAWLASETAKEEKDPPRYAGFHASECFAGCPESVLALIKDCLRWKPEHRLTLSAARQSGFLQPPGKTPQSVFSMEQGKIGTGTILEANLDPDLLHYLQGDSCWGILAKQRVDTDGATRSKCVRAGERAKGFKTEIPGIVDETNPPKCRTLNRDKNLTMIPSLRFAAFQRALRKKWRPWLQQLQQKMRLAVKSDNLPEAIVNKNGKPIMEEDFAHNAFAYASIQIMEPGARDDGWHTDGGCSLLHAAVTLWGTRALLGSQVGRQGSSHPRAKAWVLLRGNPRRRAAQRAPPRPLREHVLRRLPQGAARRKARPADRRDDPLRPVSRKQGEEARRHAWPCRVLQRRERPGGRALGHCPRGAP